MREPSSDPRWRPEVDPRTGSFWRRFRGRGRRGKQPHSAIDDFDLKLALDELLVGREMLRKAYALAVWRRNERREAIAEAVAKLALAARAIDEVVMRRAGICGDAVLDEKGRTR